MNRVKFPNWLGFCVLFCLLPALAAGQPLPAGSAVTIRGRVLDMESREPVYAARVTLVGTAYSTRTDRGGQFVFDQVPAGVYLLRAERLGYELLEQENFEVVTGSEVVLELPMRREATRLEEITVTPGTFSFMKSGGPVRQTMSREDIESVPQLGEDVFRAVNRLPGLSSGDYAAHFSIRGGRHDETLILLDGLELYEPYHLKDFNEGAISIVDTETIEGVELMTGGFPAMYGNKRSGVFNITSRVPPLDRTHYSFGLSFMNARAMAMGGLGQGRGSWLASARSGYLDLVFNIINQDELPSPRYHDFFGKLQLDLNANHQLSLDLLYAGDKYTFDAASTTGFRDTLETREIANNKYGNSYVWATLHSAISDRTTVRSMVSAGLVTRFRDGTERYIDPPEAIYALTNERDFSILGFQQDWTYALSDRLHFSTGVDFRRFRNTDTFTSVVGQDPNDPSPDPDAFYPVRTTTSIEDTGTRLGLYLSNRVRVFDPFVVEVGGRYDRASYTGDRDFSPRVNAALSLGGQRTLRAGWGHYRQIQGIDDVAALDEDRRYYPSELSKQWTVGLEQLLSNGGLLRVEGYFKKGSHLRPVYRNWKGGLDVFPETNEDRLLVFPRSTTSKGLEVYYDQDLGERFAVRAGYALSYADEVVDRIDNVNASNELEFDPEHPIPQDQRHAANFDCIYQMSPKWTLSGSFSLHSGWPGTLEKLVEVTGPGGESDFTLQPEKIYGVRLPTYQRLDVRATRKWTARRGDVRLFLELVNITNHSNVFGYDSFKSVNGNGDFILVQEEETWFTILPSIGASWSARF